MILNHSKCFQVSPYSRLIPVAQPGVAQAGWREGEPVMFTNTSLINFTSVQCSAVLTVYTQTRTAAQGDAGSPVLSSFNLSAPLAWLFNFFHCSFLLHYLSNCCSYCPRHLLPPLGFLTRLICAVCPDFKQTFIYRMFAVGAFVQV